MNFKALFLMVTIALTFTNCTKDDPILTPTLTQVKMCNQIDEGERLCDRDEPFFSASDQTFFVTATLKGAEESDLVTFSWYGILPDGQMVLIDDISIRAGDFGSGSTFDLKSSLTRGNDPWPVGEYEVEISLENGESVVKEFSVQ